MDKTGTRVQPITNVLELRRYLGERFPGLRLCTEQSLKGATECWATGLPEVDRLLEGGLPRGAITELIAERASCGSALVLFLLLRQAHRCREWVVVVDAHDSFDPSTLGEAIFPRLVWVRCRNTAEALKTTDLLLRDGNLSLVLLDLHRSSPRERAKIPASVWHRFQRLVKPISAMLLVVTPQALASSPQMRLQLKGRFSLKALELVEPELVDQLRVEVMQHRTHFSQEELVAQAG